MHKSTKNSINTTHEDELSSIDLQLDHVNKVLKWSIVDLENMINCIKARMGAEEIYISALAKTVKTFQNTENNTTVTNNTPASAIESINFFGNYTTTFQQASVQFQTSLDKTIELRREYIHCLKIQLDLLLKVKDSHEQKRKKVKSVLGEKNSNYVTFRTKEIIKLQRTYFNKCTEFNQFQQQLSSSTHDDETTHHLNIPQFNRPSSDEPRQSSESSRDVDNHSIPSTTDPSPPNKKSMSSFINQMKSQIANAAAVATADPTKQNARLVKLKKEISDTDQEYRQGVRKLESLRKRQIETATHAMRHVEAILLAKYDVIKSVMLAVGKQEEDVLSSEINLVRNTLDAIYAMDGKKDVEHFFIEYDKLGFTKPKPIYYDNYHYGRCKEILFGSDLDDYCADHNRTVPLVVVKCIESLEKQGGLEKEGIYRVSARQTNVDVLKNEFEKDEEAVDVSSKDVFTITSVLKSYLRELQKPLFNLSMQARTEYSNITDNEKRRLMLENRISELSKPQRDTLEFVINHLSKVEKNSNINKMNIKNLSVIFTPALFHDHNQAEHAGEWTTDKVFEDLLTYHDIVFKTADNIASSKVEVVSTNSDTTIPLVPPPPPEHTVSDSSSNANVNSPVSGIVNRKSSLSRRFSVLKSPASIPNIHTNNNNESYYPFYPDQENNRNNDSEEDKNSIND